MGGVCGATEKLLVPRSVANREVRARVRVLRNYKTIACLFNQVKPCGQSGGTTIHPIMHGRAVKQ